jgi:cytochrome c553
MSETPRHRTSDTDVLPASPAPQRWRIRKWAKVAGLVLLAEIILAPVLAAMFIWSGLYNVAATSPHLSITHKILHLAMIQSAKRHSEQLKAPPLDDARLIKRGAAHFETGCAPCHGSPLLPPSPIEIGATPPPPPLYSAAFDFTPDQLHWIVKHGIKMTAMPPWPAQVRNDEVWAMVAFLKALPGVKRDDYAELIGAQEPGASSEAGLQALSDSGDARTQGCASCHGADGNGRGGVAPRLAGLSAAYMEAQLDAFRTGARPSGIMRPVAMGLSPEKSKDLAQRFAQMAPSAVAADINADLVAKGARIAKKIGASACESCHSSPPGDPLVPTLDGQDRDYLLTQLKLFADGVRKSASAKLAHSLPDSDAEAVAAYFANRSAASTVAGAAR